MDPMDYIITDIIVSVSLFVLISLSIYYYKKYMQVGLKYFIIYLSILFFGPIFRIIGILAPRKDLAILFLKLQAAIGAISIIFFILFYVYNLKGYIDWKLPSMLSIFMAINLYDIAIYNMEVYRIDSLWFYKTAMSNIGSLAVAILVLIFILLAFYYSWKIKFLLFIAEKKRKKLAVTIFIIGTIVGASIVLVGFGLDAIYAGMGYGEVLGPLGVLVATFGTILSMYFDPYISMILPHRIKGLLVFNKAGMLLCHKYYSGVEYDPVLLSGALSAMWITFSKAIEREVDVSTFGIGDTTIVLVKHESVIRAIITYKTHPALIYLARKSLEVLSQHKDIVEAEIITSEIKEKSLEIIEKHVEPFIIYHSH